ncbi:MAG TPA: CRISPR-associated protein Cas4 [Pirellulales bacterium]|nr:CRISPR-associated protein Cas4 [Pirellulales bacterium]
MDQDDYQPILALNDLLFCERRCAMHRVEQVWVENRFTLEGTTAHKKVHAGPSEEELGGRGRVIRGLWVRSERLRLVGIADLVEFRAAADSRPPHPSPLPEGEGVPYPVEYKRGKRRRWDNDDVQLCAQALCLEEMLGVSVPAGAVFHVKSRRRREILFDERLRARTEAAARRLHELFASGETPPPVHKPRCRGCSLHELCMPEMLGERVRAARYQRGLFAIGTKDEG